MLGSLFRWTACFNFEDRMLVPIDVDGTKNARDEQAEHEALREDVLDVYATARSQIDCYISEHGLNRKSSPGGRY